MFFLDIFLFKKGLFNPQPTENCDIRISRKFTVSSEEILIKISFQYTYCDLFREFLKCLNKFIR